MSVCKCESEKRERERRESEREHREESGNGFFESAKAEVRFPDFNRMNLPLLVVP